METNIVGSFFRNKAPLHITSRLNDAVWRNFCKQSCHVNLKIQYFFKRVEYNNTITTAKFYDILTVSYKNLLLIK